MSWAKVGTAADFPLSVRSNPTGTIIAPPSTTGGSGGEFAFLFQFGEPLLQPAGQFVGTLPGQAGVEFGIDPACQLLVLQLSGAVIPVVDLLGEPILHRGLRFVDQLFLAVSQFAQVPRHKMQGGVFHGHGFQAALYPFGGLERLQGLNFFGRQRPVVEIRGRTGVRCLSVGIDFDELHPLGYNAAIAGAVGAGVLDGVFQEEQSARPVGLIGVVDKNRPAFQQVAMPLDDQVERGIE